jgi:hypothetical protein
MKKIMAAVLILTALICGCERKNKVIKSPNSSSRAQVIGKHDGSLIGPGYLKVGNVQVVVQNHKIFVNGVNYGSIPKEAETRVHVDDDGGFEIWVNDERRHPDTRKNQNQSQSNRRIRLN